LRILASMAQWLFILCLPLLLAAGSIGGAVNSQWLYEYGFQKYNVSQTTGLAESELKKAASGLISYFNSEEELISLTVIKDSKPFVLFNDKEVAHLKDVKGLIWLNYKVSLATFIYTFLYIVAILFWRKEKQRLAKDVLYGSGLTLVLMVLLGIGVLLNFDQLFLQFHLLSFANNLWMLDPSKDYLIMLFPGGFWYDAALFCVLATLGGTVILGGVAWGYLRYRRKSTKVSSG